MKFEVYENGRVAVIAGEGSLKAHRLRTQIFPLGEKRYYGGDHNLERSL
jgi:hypothetical protein